LQTLPVLLNNSRYALRLPIGKEDILKNFKPETIKSFYHDWYRPICRRLLPWAILTLNVLRAHQTKLFAIKNPAGEKPRTKYSVPRHLVL
jgi:zinc protease